MVYGESLVWVYGESSSGCTVSPLWVYGESTVWVYGESIVGCTVSPLCGCTVSHCLGVL